jgi:hypothetical protein
LAAFALFAGFLATQNASAALPTGLLALGKIGFDMGSLVFLLDAYRRWTGQGQLRRLGLAWVCLLVEPFSFQVLRNLGAARGWLALLAGRLEWGGSSRSRALTVSESARQ